MPNNIVAVVAFDRISLFHLSVPCVVFGEALAGTPKFDVRVCAPEPGPLRTSAGLEVTVPHGLDVLAEADTVVVPSWRDPAERPPQAVLDGLVAAHARGARVVGLCLGAYVLAEAGLLDGRPATTHWAYAQDFAARYPKVALDPNVLYVEDDMLLTSAGTAAGIDACLYMLRAGHGAELANRVARRLVVPPHRQGGQAQFIEQPLPSGPGDAHLADLIDWMRANLDLPHTLDSLAAKAHMSRRTFTRHFRERIGATFGDWLLAERLTFAQRLLETTGHSVEVIAALAGFGSPVSLRHHFRRNLGVSPSAWRSTFQGNRRALSAGICRPGLKIVSGDVAA